MLLLIWSVYMLISTLTNKYEIAPLERLLVNKYVHYLVYMLISTQTNKYVIAPLERLLVNKLAF